MVVGPAVGALGCQPAPESRVLRSITEPSKCSTGWEALPPRERLVQLLSQPNALVAAGTGTGTGSGSSGVAVVLGRLLGPARDLLLRMMPQALKRPLFDLVMRASLQPQWRRP